MKFGAGTDEDQSMKVKGQITVLIKRLQSQVSGDSSMRPFERGPVTNDGRKYFGRRNPNDFIKYHTLLSDHVQSELKGSHFLIK